MRGVEILTSSEVVVKSDFNWIVFWITGGVILGVFVFGGIMSYLSDGYGFLPILGGGFVAAMIFGFAMGAATSIPSEYVTEYKVTISNEVSKNEFDKHYEVIDVDGKIFTVREKELRETNE